MLKWATYRLAGAVRRSLGATPDRDQKTALPRRRTHSIRLLDRLGCRLDQIDNLGRGDVRPMRNLLKIQGKFRIAANRNLD